MKQEIIIKATEIQKKINDYEKVYRYVSSGCLTFDGSVGQVDLYFDRELARFIGIHCIKKIEELKKEFEEL